MPDLELSAEVKKVSTTPDGGWRLVFETGNDAGPAILALTSLREKNLKLIVRWEE